MSEDHDSLKSQLEAATNALYQERLERVQAEAFARFPEAREFADLIIANTAEEYLSMAEAIAERARRLGPVGDAGVPVPAEAPTAHVTEPAPPTVSDVDLKVQAAMNNRDFLGLFHAKAEAAEAGAELAELHRAKGSPMDEYMRGLNLSAHLPPPTAQ